jgi:hypothetical protein
MGTGSAILRAPYYEDKTSMPDSPSLSEPCRDKGGIRWDTAPVHQRLLTPPDTLPIISTQRPILGRTIELIRPEGPIKEGG